MFKSMWSSSVLYLLITLLSVWSLTVLNPLLNDKHKYICVSDTCWSLIKSHVGRKEDFCLILCCFINLHHCSSVRSQGVSDGDHRGTLCVCVCHTWTTCWCPAWRASQTSARTSCVTCATTHIVCEKVTELSLEERLLDLVLFID